MTRDRRLVDAIGELLPEALQSGWLCPEDASLDTIQLIA